MLPTEILIEEINKNLKGKQILYYDIEIPTLCFICENDPDKDGYPRTTFNGKRYRLLRLLWSLNNGKIPNKHLIRHSCNNPKCINLEHLSLGTSKDNVNDMIKAGRMCKGSKHPISKLTESQVRKILKDKRTQKEISETYNVCQQLISKIKTRKMWRYL